MKRYGELASNTNLDQGPLPLVFDITIADALYMMLDMMGRVLRDYDWTEITNGKLVQNYTTGHSSQGLTFSVQVVEDSHMIIFERGPERFCWEENQVNK